MRIGILTYHTGYNYGASLQAYALQTTVNKLAGSCEIINFETSRFVASREMFSRRPQRVKELVKIITRLPYWTSLHKRQAMFDKFTAECLNTSALYKTEKELIEHAEDYECIICGSDQIWNLSESDPCAANPVYFLNFPKKQKRISYAASFGKWVSEAAQHENIFLPWIKEFDAVSVREISGYEYLKSRGIYCDLVVDPTLLLDADDYNKICADRIIDEKYILLFGWNTNSDLVEAAKMISSKMGLPVYNIVPPPRAIFSGTKRKLDVGPCEFLSMVKHSEFVVTNSFHGTVFSTIYNKPYVSLVSGKADTRMHSILKQLGLENRLITKEKIVVDDLMSADYEDVNNRKRSLCKSSIEYLKRALGVKSAEL